MTDLMKGIYYFDQMPLQLQSIYLERITDDHLNTVNEMYFENFVQFLSESFIWHETPEGYEFWLDVSKFNFHETI
jgi:hypothetical protein